MILRNTIYILVLVIASFATVNLYGQVDEETYQKAIISADKYFNEADYINAKASYQFALNARPGDPYAQQKLQESIQMIKVQLELNQRYTAKILLADELFKAGKYAESRKAYEESLTIIAGDRYASQQIISIDSIVADNQKKEADYQTFLNQGNDHFAVKKYQEALESYQKAALIKPADAALKSKISEAEVLLNNEQSVLGEYEKALQQADQFVERKAYDNAILQLETAIKLKPEESTPKQRLQEVKALKASQDAYDAIIAEGDSLYINKNFDGAKAKYKEALVINPNDAYVKNILDRIDIAITESEQLIESGYLVAITKADEYFSQEQYDKALVEYQNAMRIKPDEKYAREKITEVNNALGFQKAQQEAYSNTIAKADKLYKEENYEGSLAEFQKAKELKPNEQYPEVKIDEINDILSKLKTKREQYNAVVTGADKLFFADDYEEARDQYRKALEMFPDEKYPADQIIMINEILGRRDTYVKAITTADMLLADKKYDEAALEYRNAIKVIPDDQYAQQKIFEITLYQESELKAQELESDYLEMLDRADSAYLAGDFEGSVIYYNDAQSLKPKEDYPKQRIAQIEELKAEKLREQENDARYDGLISQADQYKLTKDYNGALALYKDALKIKPDETYPAQQITDINQILQAEAKAEADMAKYQQLISEADQYFGNKNYQSALYAYQSALNLNIDNNYPQEQINRIQILLEEQRTLAKKKEDFDNTILEADQLYNAGKFEESIVMYQKAASIDPEQTYPQQRIAIANDRLAEIAEIESERKAEEEKYLNLIAQGDAMFSRKDYDAALKSYGAALNLKPGEAYPTGKLTEIQAIKDEIARKEQLEKDFSEFVKKGDAEFEAKNYQDALAAYRSAIALNAEAEYPNRKIQEINAILLEIEKEQDIQRKYDEAIAYADRHLQNTDYEKALSEYRVANSIKPGETYPLEKIDQINAALAAIAQQKELDNKYNKAVADADRLLAEEKYSEAMEAYETAKSLKEEEVYPMAQIQKIQQRLATMEEEKQKAYDEALTKADTYFSTNQYEMAKINYETALKIKPDELYPLEKLKEANDALTRQRQILQESYDKAIADADKFYVGKIYDEALEAYRQAAQIKVNEQYPQEMIRRILKLMSERAVADINKDPLIIKDNTTQKFDFAPVSVQYRKSNYIYFKARNMTEKEHKIIISFGKDGVKNGGFVVKVPVGTDVHDYIVRISSQYKWFSDDNNWLSMIPQGGDIEVALVQISFAD